MWQKIKKDIDDIVEGKKIYNRLKMKCHKHVMYISQHPAIGDAYLVASYLKIFIQKKDVVTFIGQASKKVYELYKFENLVELTQWQTDSLIRYVQFMEISSDEVVILHYQALVEHTGLAFQFNGVRGLCFSELLEKMVFRGYEYTDRFYPNLNRTINFTNVEKNSSVIFFPYANTLNTPPLEFWSEVIDRYIERGKSVYTYVWKNEKPLKKTIPITCELTEIFYLVEWAGELVGVRNGIMDLVSQSKCKKTIYYPKHGAESWINGSIKEFWSLKKFGYGTLCNEIEWGD